MGGDAAAAPVVREGDDVVVAAGGGGVVVRELVPHPLSGPKGEIRVKRVLPERSGSRPGEVFDSERSVEQEQFKEGIVRARLEGEQGLAGADGAHRVNRKEKVVRCRRVVGTVLRIGQDPLPEQQAGVAVDGHDLPTRRAASAPSGPSTMSVASSRVLK